MPRCTLHESDRRIFRDIAAFARDESHDHNTQNAAVVAAPPYTLWPIGTNRLPDGIEVTPGRLTAPAKYDWMVHAEVAALLRADYGSTLYALWAACPACAVAIVESGISRVVTLRATQDATPERWRVKVATGMEILRAGGVEVEFFDGRLDETIRFDGTELRL